MRPVERLIEHYGKEENYETHFVTEEDFEVAGPVSACNLSDAVRFILWREDYVNYLSNLYDNDPSFTDKSVRLIVLHEIGHGDGDSPKNRYEPRAELYAVSKWQGDPLEAITVGIAQRLYYGKSRGYFEPKNLDKGKIERILLDKYCPWLREDLKEKVMDEVLELIK